MLYEKMPAVFEAHQVNVEDPEACAHWCGGGLMYNVDENNVKTLTAIIVKSGRMSLEAKPGDYIVKNNQGEFYVENQETFESVYVEKTP